MGLSIPVVRNSIIFIYSSMHYLNNVCMLALIAKICIDQVNILTLHKNLFFIPGVVLTSHLEFHDSEDEDLGK